MNNDREPIEAFKRALSITAVAERLGLEPVHGKFRCFHPTRHAHGDRTPSVSLSEERGLFRCWVCPDFKGDVIQLVCDIRNCEFLDAVQWLREGWPVAAAAYVRANAQQPDGPTHGTAGNVATPPLAAVHMAPKPAPQGHELTELSLGLPQRPEHWREKTILAFLKLLSPVDKADPHGRHEARDYLIKRKIFMHTWNEMRLRWVDDYGRVNDALRKEQDADLLREVGLMNDHGNLRFYKHRLILPYLDSENHPLHFQARATDYETTPKELSLRGTIPVPYNRKVLDGLAGVVYLCEGPIDTLTLIERRIPAVGVPGVSHLKADWIPLFTNKRVCVCFDKDEAGKAATVKVIEAFKSQGIDAFALEALPDGSDINEWFVRK